MISRMFGWLFGRTTPKQDTTQLIKEAAVELAVEPDFEQDKRKLEELSVRVEAAQDHLRKVYKILEIRDRAR